MSCQICVEVCPFDAIKMDQVFELAATDRFSGLMLDRDALAKPNSYFHEIHPTEAAEVDARLAADAQGRRGEGQGRRRREGRAEAGAAAPPNRPPRPARRPRSPPRPPHEPRRDDGRVPPRARPGPAARLAHRVPAGAGPLAGERPARDRRRPRGLRPAVRLPDAGRAQDPRPRPEPPRAQPHRLVRPAAAVRRRHQDADEGGHRPARRRPGAALSRAGRADRVLDPHLRRHPVRPPPGAGRARRRASSTSSPPARRRSSRSSWPAGRATTSTRFSPRCAPWPS